MRGGHWLQRGHFHDPASKVVGKVWPLLWNSGQRIVGGSGWSVGEAEFGVKVSGWKVGVGASGWMSLLLSAGGGRGES